MRIRLRAVLLTQLSFEGWMELPCLSDYFLRHILCHPSLTDLWSVHLYAYALMERRGAWWPRFRGKPAWEKARYSHGLHSSRHIRRVLVPHPTCFSSEKSSLV